MWAQNGIPQRSLRIRGSFFVIILLLVSQELVRLKPVWGQSSVASTSIRPFVTGQIPIIGRGGVVGGVLVDAAGVVERGDVDTLERLRDMRTRSLEPISDELRRTSPLRKVSLKGIAATIEHSRLKGIPITDDLQHLAGLQRVQFVFVYPEQRDIVLAGIAEGWRIDAHGNVVGQSTGSPVLQLDDLVVALRTARDAGTGDGITCSMDPTPEGTQRVQKLLASRGLQMNPTTIGRLEAALGPQQIRLTGVPPGSHFAYVMVAADVMLKRLGMNYEPSPVSGMPGYLEMLQKSASSGPHNAMPRFWLAPNYEPLLKDPDGLAWQLRGPGVQALAEDAPLKSAETRLVGRTKGKSLADQWAETITDKYPALAAALPAFQELRNCMDLAVIAALFMKEDLPGKANCDLSLFLDEKRLKIAQYHVPKTMPSRATALPKGRQWIIGLSGGIELNSWPVLDRIEVATGQAEARNSVKFPPDNRWWWD
jgi:hypothetical protein